MESVKLSVQFGREPAIYVTGETVNGHIMLEVNPEIDNNQSDKSAIVLRNFTVSIHGDARNYWVNKTSDKIYENSQVYLDHKLDLIKAPAVFDVGRHKFPFEFVLPTAMPSSFETEYGRILYSVRAAAYLNADAAPSLVGRSDASVERQFGVVAQLKLSSLPSTKQPVEAIDATDFSCCCVPFGSVRAVITLPKNGYLINDQILIDAVILNGTPKTLKHARFSLIQRAKFLAVSRYENVQDSKERQFCVANLDKGVIRPRQCMRLEREAMNIQFLVPSYRGSIVNIDYLLRFEADPEIEIEMPLTIGTSE